MKFYQKKLSVVTLALLLNTSSGHRLTSYSRGYGKYETDEGRAVAALLRDNPNAPLDEKESEPDGRIVLSMAQKQPLAKVKKQEKKTEVKTKPESLAEIAEKAEEQNIRNQQNYKK